MGFATLDDAKKLQFDLTESARTERSAKRESLNWADFSSTGFSRGDAPLSATLQFSTPVANTISSWPAHHAEIDKKVKNTEKALPPFGWDTEPVIVNEEIIEEAFVDVFCDLLYGGGWMDLESSERECNWALVEFKSLPPNRSTVSGDADPRTSTTRDSTVCAPSSSTISIHDQSQVPINQIEIEIQIKVVIDDDVHKHKRMETSTDAERTSVCRWTRTEESDVPRSGV
ncbi:hypothetical protein J132_00152 [Termitomyces sp. J132]|nr:hypothetical protein J132_00152 [Termitomyces sp. J132]